MILLTREEYKKLKENPSTATIPVPLPVPVTQTKTVEVVKEITPTDLSQEAERKGFVLVPKDEHSLLKKAAAPLTPDQLKSKANGLGLYLLSPAEYAILKSPVTPVRVVNEKSLRSDAERLGFTILPISEFKELYDLRDKTLRDETITDIEVRFPFHFLCFFQFTNFFFFFE